MPIGYAALRSAALAAILALAPPAAAQERPAAKPAEKPAAAQPAKPAPPADQDLKIAGDARKRYFLINPKPSAPPPKEGYKLLIVLPGGDGSEEFHPFVKNLAAQALPPGYLVAQAVAPEWSKADDRIVWPTVKLRDPKMKFPTEDFIAAIVKDVKAKAAVNPDYVFMLGWSSGGPPCYATALRKDSPVTGAFVAMSVFKPEVLPALDAAKGKAFYILHSPTDFIPMSFPEAARSKLAAKGASTQLDTYEGGHGWHGDVMGNIRKGVAWLESEASKRK